MKPADRPSDTGWWMWRATPADDYKLVEVVATLSSGRHCPALKMGGSNMYRGKDWSGEWL